METTPVRNSRAAWLVAAGLGLAPWLGGQLKVSPLPIEPGFGGWFGGLFGPELPTSAHLVLGLFFTVAMSITLLGRKVVPVPQAPIVTAAFLLVIAALLGISQSEFRWLSVIALVEWMLYIVAFAAVVATSGRKEGGKLYLAAFGAGVTLLALRGILEFGQMRGIDPSWRIFAGWIQPNALATMLVLGIFALLGLGPVTDRVAGLLVRLGLGLLGMALFLTGSKGGLLALAVGLVFWVVLLAISKSGRQVLGAVPVVIGIGLALISMQTAKPNAAGAASRVAQASGTQEQSAGYRQLLWRGAVEVIGQNPLGTGLGTYPFENARSGLTPQTVTTHQGFLQAGFEGGWLFLGALVGFAGTWLYRVFSGFRKLEPERQWMLSGVVAGVVAFGANNFVESGFQQFGSGLACFALMGLGVQLAANAATPEYLPTVLRKWVGLGVLVLITVIGFRLQVIEVGLARLRFEVGLGQVEAAQSRSSFLRSIAPEDGDVLISTVGLTQPPTIAEDVRRLAEIAPSTKNLRLAAKQFEEEYPVAREYLNRALVRDPNNGLTLMQKMALELKHSPEAATETLDKIIATESTPYFTVRALPEFIPTESAQARVAFVKAQPGIRPDETKLLEDSLAQFQKFRQVTVPVVEQMAGSDPNAVVGGESKSSVVRKMSIARDAAEELAKRYRAAGDPVRAEAVSALAREFGEVAVRFGA